MSESKVAELRFFGGLRAKEIVPVLEVSPETVARNWWLAKTWLLREMSGEVHGA